MVNVRTLGGVNAQVDRCGTDALVLARLGLRLAHNLIADLVEIVELLARHVEELAPLLDIALVVRRAFHLCRSALTIAILHAVRLGLGQRSTVDELQDKWPSRHDASTAG